MSNRLESSMQKEHSHMTGDDRLAFLYGRCYSTLAIKKSLPVDTAPAESLRDWAFTLIESDAQDIAYRIVLHRYYTMALFHRCSRASAPSTSGFLAMNNNGDCHNRRPGNSLYNSEADMAKRILKEVAPGFEPESPVYKHKFDHIQSRRIRGKGYHTLSTHSGPGILALIPSTDQLGQNRIGLSENG
ncbi:hypothetical protein BDQ94DRAFT_179235 [Aspergillus welwitschiae]|uniref:Uncharacterized protein n=1 Tax=Aspergillus welwitschiae TaxID=1341132 RepID=A0A3F3PHS0_9EURO|nr:hypothetical protein BDQ94DRAFT_179235 [Aspergillus welwitschiae]RDH26222.1 hypothetical protein BDQ94DRAFT_179235 [Aspergillus welwitschiae]